jgi:hypothetical protein
MHEWQGELQIRKRVTAKKTAKNPIKITTYLPNAEDGILESR